MPQVWLVMERLSLSLKMLGHRQPYQLSILGNMNLESTPTKH